jgi:4-amino-4-deoxy-L-arabinose transferase-like glycosyltransferase
VEQASSKSSRSPVELVLVAAFCAYLFFYGLGNFGLVGPDEPRYAQVAREMHERNDYITPTLNGEGWFEKPALYYWRAMFAYETFGVKDWAARLPSATFALGMVVIIFFHMRRFRPGAQLDAALITASCAAVVGFSRAASTDMQLAAPFTVAMLGWYAWYETRHKIWLFDLYFFLAIATLAKGPVAPFLAGLIVLVFCYLHGEWKTAFRTLWLPGIAVFLLIALPWFILVQLENPRFFRIFILEHNLARFSTDLFQHTKPFWYYGPILLLALAPWTFFAIPAVVDASRNCLSDWRKLWAEKKAPGGAGDRIHPDPFPEFLVLWAVIPILFFSLSQSKLPGYILPAIAPFTILLADYLLRMRGRRISRLVIAAHAAMCGLIVGFFLVFPYYFLQGIAITGTARLLTALIAVLVFFTVYFVLQRFGPQFLRFVTLLPVILVVGFILRVAAPTVDDHYSARPVDHALSALAHELHEEGRPVAVFEVRRDLRYGLAFYRNQKIFSYNENEVPTVEHLLVACAESKCPEARAQLARRLDGRKVRRVGEFAPQKLEFYYVEAAVPAHPLPSRGIPSRH